MLSRSRRQVPAYLEKAAGERKLEDARRSSYKRRKKPRSEWEDIVGWAHKYFYLYDTAELLHLYEVQAKALRMAVALRDDGDLEYSTVIWSWPKKSAKSTIIALVCDWVAYHKPKAMIRLVGNDLRQADSRVGHYLRENIKIGKELGYPNDPYNRMQEFRKQTKISTSNYVIEYPNGSKVEMVPVDPTGEAGGNDDIIVFSELWGWSSKAHLAMWSEMTVSPNRFGQAQRWVDTYAGFDGGSPVLQPLYDNLVKEENRVDQDYEYYASGRTFGTWITKHHLPWQSPAYYAQEESDLEPSEYRRMHENSWVQSTSAFVPMEWFIAGQRAFATTKPEPEEWEKYIPAVAFEEELVLAIDAGTDSDCFAMWAGTKIYHYDHATQMDIPFIVTRYVNVWYPEDYGRFTFKEPIEEIRRLCKAYNIIQVAYDRYQLKHLVDELEEENLAWFEEFDQQAERDIADKLLYDMIRQKKFIHWGDPEQVAHIKNADKENNGKRLRIVKRDPKLKIDLTVATSMGAKRAMDLVSNL